MGKITGEGRERLEKQLGDDFTQQSLTKIRPKICNKLPGRSMKRAQCKILKNYLSTEKRINVIQFRLK